mmetsp:Transcript_42578/g.70864  ORF Transcript_42578/g.70864 Transcript_42578/m.70864 type:complete len:286 (+) Transcript_42578:646-1503(+)
MPKRSRVSLRSRPNTRRNGRMLSERGLITSFLLSLQPLATMRDMPVFLPVLNPSTPFRLITVLVTAGVQACLLCGPDPPLDAVERQVYQCFGPVAPALRVSAGLIARAGIPKTLSFDTGVAGFWLVHSGLRRVLRYTDAATIVIPLDALKLKGGKSSDPIISTGSSSRQYDLVDPPPATLLSFKPSSQSKEEIGLERILAAFYRSVYSLLPRGSSSLKAEPASLQPPQQHSLHAARVLAESYSLHALVRPPLELYVALSRSVPSYALQAVAEDTLAVLSNLDSFK